MNLRTEQISAGLSGDMLCRVESDAGKWLLRVSDAGQYGHKKKEFGRMRHMRAHGVPMPRPAGFGVCGGIGVYQLMTWLDGENLETILPGLPEREQYALGREAGEILRKIHSVPMLDADVPAESWNERYSAFIDESVREFHECGVKAGGAEVLTGYFDDNRRLLETRPQCYAHNDFHAGNLILSPGGELCVVDWQILLFENVGDPWKELERLETPHFSSGLIGGYFGGEPPEEFWRVLALYVAVGAVSAITWAYYLHPEFLEAQIQHCAEVLEWYGGMKNVVPKWYIRKV